MSQSEEERDRFFRTRECLLPPGCAVPEHAGGGSQPSAAVAPLCIITRSVPAEEGFLTFFSPPGEHVCIAPVRPLHLPSIKG
jgi:hypothetical protein